MRSRVHWTLFMGAVLLLPEPGVLADEIPYPGGMHRGSQTIGSGAGDGGAGPQEPSSPEKVAADSLRVKGAKLDLDANRDVQSLVLSGSQFDDESIRLASQLPKLRDLGITSAPVTDDGLAHLESMGSLRRLTISRCRRITDTGIAHLENLIGLEHLGLLYLPSLTDASLDHVKSLTNLKMLELGQTRITDEGLKAFAGLRDLERLYIYDTAITGEGLKHLRDLAKLQTLLLRGTKLNDEGLKHLEGMTGLRELVLTDTTSDSYAAEITDSGIARLKEALPDCKISR